jgi:uncharacterized protein (TIGR03000 family)
LVALLAPDLQAQEGRASPVLIYLTVPADATVAVEGTPIRQTGPVRKLITPPIPYGERGAYTVTAIFTRDGKAVSVEREIIVEGGKVTRADLTEETPRPAATQRADPDPVEFKAAPKTPDPGPTARTGDLDQAPKKDEAKKDPPKEVRLDVPYVATPQKVVEEMLKLGGVKEGDVVYDLGCGDGRIVVTAVKSFKAKRGLGLDIDPQRIAEAMKNAKDAKVEGQVEFREADILKLTDVSEASVVTLYLLPEINEKLKPMLRRTLKPGSRVVSHDFDMGDDWKPEKEVTVRDSDGRDHTIYLWTIPERKKAEPKKDRPEPAAAAPKKDEAKRDEPTIKVPYVPTPQSVVEEMLKLGGVKESDVVYDLGCGDGRIVVTAVKSFKAKRGVGVDIDPERIKESKQAAKAARVEDKVEFREGDVLKITDVSDATVVCLYLFPEVNERLKPMLQRTLKPGSRVVSHDFLMGDDWKPEKEVTVRDADGQEHTLYLWTIKEKK